MLEECQRLALRSRPNEEGERTVQACSDPVGGDLTAKGHLKIPLMNKCTFYLQN